MILFKKLHSHFGALAVTFAEFQIIQDELLALIFNGGLYGIFGIIYVFHYIIVSQFHTADTDGTFLFLGDLIDGEAQSTTFNMDWAVAKITRHRFSSFWLVMYMISSFF